MNITPEEAQEALDAIQQTTVKTRRGLAISAYHLILWGLVWFFGFLASQFVQLSMLGWVWLIGISLGTVGSILLGISQSRRTRIAPGSRLALVSSRVGMFIPIMYGYGILWFVIFQPLNPLQSGLFWITLIMFAYVVVGVWLRSPLLIGIGIGVTVIALLGYYIIPTYFFLWAALFAGGPLVGSGVYGLLRWR